MTSLIKRQVFPVHMVRVKRAFVRRFSITAIGKAVSNIHKGVDQVYQPLTMTLISPVQHMRRLA